MRSLTAKEKEVLAILSSNPQGLFGIEIYTESDNRRGSLSRSEVYSILNDLAKMDLVRNETQPVAAGATLARVKSFLTEQGKLACS